MIFECTGVHHRMTLSYLYLD